MPAPRIPVRRTQEERRDETQYLLQKATIELLLTVGYSRLTTSDVARVAGVSRGALTHHYADKEDLVVRSIAQQLRGTADDLRSFAETQMANDVGTDEVLDHLWDLMSGGLFYVTMEYLPEVRHNKEFHRRIVLVVQEFHAALDAVWVKLSQGAGIEPARAKVILNATMCLLRGMVAQTVLRSDQAYFQEILNFWKAQLQAEFSTASQNRTARRRTRRASGHGPPP